MFGPMGQGKPNADGSFEITNTPPDRYNVFISGLPSGAYVKSIRSDPVDVLATGLDITTGAPPADVEVVISPKGAAVTGVAQNSTTGNPMPGAMVVLIPVDQPREEQPTFYKFIVSDQNGAFSMTGLTPGDYKAYARSGSGQIPILRRERPRALLVVACQTEIVPDYINGIGHGSLPHQFPVNGWEVPISEKCPRDSRRAGASAPGASSSGRWSLVHLLPFRRAAPRTFGPVRFTDCTAIRAAH